MRDIKVGDTYWALVHENEHAPLIKKVTVTHVFNVMVTVYILGLNKSIDVSRAELYDTQDDALSALHEFLENKNRRMIDED